LILSIFIVFRQLSKSNNIYVFRVSSVELVKIKDFRGVRKKILKRMKKVVF